MIRLGKRDGRVRLGPVILVLLVAAVAAMLLYRYSTRADSLNNEAIELMNQGKYDSATKILKEALEIDAQHVEANFNLGLCLVERHRFDEALEAFTRTSLLDPGRADTHYQKGRILWMQKRYKEAIGPLERAGELKSPYPEAWIVLAECLYEKHLRTLAAEPESGASPAAAQAAFKAYLKQRPEAPDKHIVEHKLEILSKLEKYPEVLEKRRQLMEWEKQGAKEPAGP